MEDWQGSDLCPEPFNGLAVGDPHWQSVPVSDGTGEKGVLVCTGGRLYLEESVRSSCSPVIQYQWIFWHFNDVVTDLKEHLQSGQVASVLEGFPAKVMYHLGNTAGCAICVLVGDKPGGLPLDLF